MIDGEIGEHLANAARVVIVADDAGEHDLGAQGTQHGGNTGGSAEAFFAALGAQQNHGRFLADAFGVAPDVAVEHGVADDEDARGAEVLYEID